jgi:hypothetical protein
MGFKETECEDVDWIHLVKDRDVWQALVNMVMNLWVPENKEHFDKLNNNHLLMEDSGSITVRFAPVIHKIRQ